jgi:hypothetical protein
MPTDRAHATANLPRAAANLWRQVSMRTRGLARVVSLCHDRPVDDRVLWAAANNARWCDLVCRSHGIPTAMHPGVWVALRRAPELYPDAVTLLPGVVAEDALRSAPDGPGCSGSSVSLRPRASRPVGAYPRRARAGRPHRRRRCESDRISRRRKQRVHNDRARGRGLVQHCGRGCRRLSVVVARGLRARRGPASGAGGKLHCARCSPGVATTRDT